MSWIAISAPKGAERALPGHRSPGFPISDGSGELDRGTLIVEFRPAPVRRPEAIFDIRDEGPTTARMALFLLPGGSLALVLSRGEQLAHAALPMPEAVGNARLRFTYRWDRATGDGSVWLNLPTRAEQGAMRRVECPVSPPRIPLLVAAQSLPQQMVSGCVEAMAVADSIEPVGPMPGIAGPTLIDTPFGPRRADSLQRGDLVSLADGGSAPILQMVRAEVPAMGSLAPVTVMAPRFGLERDVILSTHQRFGIGGSNVEYMFGAERALVSAGDLVGDGIAALAQPRRTIEYVQFLLPRRELVSASGAMIESFDIGRMRRRKPLHEASLLAGVPAQRLPEHMAQAFPVLSHFQAITLADYRAA